MPTTTVPPGKDRLTPCRLSQVEWPTCFAHECYMNYRCPVYRGGRPQPERDYLPLPAIFIMLGPFEAIPFSYRIPMRIDVEE